MGKSKRGVADRVRKAKNAKATNVFKVQSNPFEVKINKQKHKILGRKTKHDRGLPGVSRSKANKKRKETLLKEYKERHKTNNVLDERFGEGATDISVEEKMLQRFAMEKKRKHDKMSLFNLNDDEEVLTHFGQSLSEIRDFETNIQSDEEDSGMISGEYVSEAHFGGGIFTKKSSNIDEADGGGDEEKPKSRKEIIDEIILKSKKAKFEKQSAQDEANTLREKLDDTWQEVEKLLKSSSRTTKDKETAKEQYQPDEYDVAVKQMQYDRKAAPAARGKTDAEKAAEESARMRKSEEERIERMQQDYDHKTEKSTHRSADDLNYDFLPEKDYVEPIYYKDGVMVTSEMEENDNNDWRLEPQIENIEENEDREEDNSGDKTSLSEGEDDFSDIVTDDENNEDDQFASDEENYFPDEDDLPDIDKIYSKSMECKGPMKFPESYLEFCRISTSKFDGKCDKCVSSLRNKFSSGLAKGNKEKLKILFEYTWQSIYDLCLKDEPKIENINTLIRHFYELCQENTLSCAKFVVAEMYRTYKSYLLRSGKIAIPNFGHILQFKLIKILFSTSDFFHPVATPAVVFMSHIVHSCRPANLRDLSSCLFICTLLYEYVCFSKRFIPEVINFLCAVVCMATPKISQSAGLPAAASLYLNSKNCELLVMRNGCSKSWDRTQKPDLINLLTKKDPDSLNQDQIRLQLLNTTLRLIMKFVLLNGRIQCFKEIHEPLVTTCELCISGHRKSNEGQNHPLAELLYGVQAEIDRIMKKTPHPAPLVQAESNKPKPLQLYDPKIEEVCEPFQKSANKKTSAAKRERERLQHKYKREMKGAVREIKKDARFIAREQLNEQIEKDKDRAAKVKRLYGLLSNQEGDVKKINRKKFKLGVS